VALSEKKHAVTTLEVTRNVQSMYYQLAYAKELEKLFLYQDSVYKDFSNKAELKFKVGESSYLEMLTAQSKYEEIRVRTKQLESDIRIYRVELQRLLSVPYEVAISDDKLKKLTVAIDLDSSAVQQNPMMDWFSQKIKLANSQLSLEKNRYLPDFSAGYINKTLDNVPGYEGGQIGVNIPLFYWGQKGRVQSAKVETQIAEIEYQAYQTELQTSMNKQYQEYEKNAEMLRYQERLGLKQSDEILHASQRAYSKGEIGYVEYTQNLSFSIKLKVKYMQVLNQYNQTIININYLTGSL
jgi:cobalt-zinc-cadmium resistance protein CzcA